MKVTDPLNNTLPSIDEIWAFVSVDAGGEGVVAAKMGAAWMPLIAADKARLKDLIPIAKEVAKATGKTVKLIKFTTREEVAY